MPTYAVTYEYDDRAALRDELRPAHRFFLRALLEDGVLLASGPLGTTGPGALIVLSADSADAALAVLDADPFRTAGLIASRQAREWDPVLGPWA